MRTDPIDIAELQKELDATLADRLWLRILEVFVPSGVADGLHLRQATGLDRDKLRRAMEKIESANAGLPPAIRILDHSIARVGARGRAPNVYLLGESGAALLNANGYREIPACGLNDDISISHALAVLSVHLTAVQAGLGVHTEQYQHYGDENHIRPDHRILLPDGSQLLLEVEQLATRKLIPRILESLTNKQAFFQSEESRGFSREVRMLVNVPRGREWSRTIRVWREACNLVVQQANEPLAFRLLAIPLDEFLSAPEWGEASRRWEEPSACIPREEIKESDPSSTNLVSLNATPQRSSRDDWVLLSALLQQYRESPEKQQTRQPDADFFEVIILIYSASHPGSRDFWQRAAFPHASIYLLKRYLEMHPALLKKLQRCIHYGKGRIRWNTTTVIHRMQQVINTFLAYHGWRSNGPLQAIAMTGEWEGVGPFGVEIAKNGFWHFSEDQEHERKMCPALTWILWALFEYAEELGLGRPEFW